MSVRTTLSRISVGMMLTTTAASTSFAQRIEPHAASSRTLTSERDRNGAQLTAREPINPWRGVAGGVLSATINCSPTNSDLSLTQRIEHPKLLAQRTRREPRTMRAPGLSAIVCELDTFPTESRRRVVRF